MPRENADRDIERLFIRTFFTELGFIRYVPERPDRDMISGVFKQIADKIPIQRAHYDGDRSVVCTMQYRVTAEPEEVTDWTEDMEGDNADGGDNNAYVWTDHHGLHWITYEHDDIYDVSLTVKDGKWWVMPDEDAEKWGEAKAAEFDTLRGAMDEIENLDEWSLQGDAVEKWDREQFEKDAAELARQRHEEETEVDPVPDEEGEPAEPRYDPSHDGQLDLNFESLRGKQSTTTT